MHRATSFDELFNRIFPQSEKLKEEEIKKLQQTHAKVLQEQKLKHAKSMKELKNKTPKLPKFNSKEKGYATTSKYELTENDFKNRNDSKTQHSENLKKQKIKKVQKQEIKRLQKELAQVKKQIKLVKKQIQQEQINAQVLQEQQKLKHVKVIEKLKHKTPKVPKFNSKRNQDDKNIPNSKTNKFGNTNTPHNNNEHNDEDNNKID